MDERYGWSFETWFGQFVTVAASLLGVALIIVSTCDYLIDRYQWKLAHGEIARPAIFASVRAPTAPVSTDTARPPKTVAHIQTVPLPALQLRASVSADTARQPAAKLWLSSTYHPGSAGLVDVVAAGDVMMGTKDVGLNPAIRPGADAAELVGSDLAGVFRHADVAFVNLEGPLYDGPGPSTKNCGSCFAFHSPTYYAGVLQSLGVDVVSMANNHSGDYGEQGRGSTMAALRLHGIGFAGLDREGARFATLNLPNGKKGAVIAFAPNSGTLNLNDIPRAQALVRDLRKTHDLVIVSFHGGGEGWNFVHVARSSEFFDGEDRGNVTAFAHAVIDAGADLVIGQGPHVPRALEIYHDRLIAYSLGNFWTYSGVMTYAVSGLGPVLEAWLTPEGKIAGFTIHSSRQAGLGVPHMDSMDEAARYMLYLTKSDFPETSARLSGAKQPDRIVAGGGEGGEARAMAGPGS
jgi:poly-gamma-glutamate capsule biosynthesis protein CapA/YwtB (metallophosphatase superfamily)